MASINPNPLVLNSLRDLSDVIARAHGRSGRDFLGKTWTVSAGHHFDNEAEPSWKQAWCYTVTEVSGVEVKVELASRITPAAKPIAPTANLATMQHAGWDITDALREGRAIGALCVAVPI